MLWGKIVNGEMQYAPPEIHNKNGVVKELKYHDDFINEGYKRVINNKPAYNPYTQYLVLDEIIEEEEDIHISYVVKNIGESISVSELAEIISEEINKE